MKMLPSRTARAALVALAAGSLVLTACSDNNGGKATGGKDQKDAASQGDAVALGDKAASTGPAAAVKGAKSGGTVTVYQENKFSHLDPAQIYVSDAGLVSKMIQRGLTTIKEDDKGGQTVVGDIATDSGKMTDGGKTWTYTLKDDLKDSQGNAISSADVRHTFERLYDPFITDGPSYIQQWLSGSGTTYRKAYPGPYKGKHLPATVLDTPDAKTVVFHFKDAQPDLPQALAMAGYSIVAKKADTKEKYDTEPAGMGPYKVAEHKVGKSLTLVKNENWKADTDAVRHQYVDGFNIEFGHDDEDQTKTIIADRGEAKNAIMMTGQVATNLVKDVVTTDVKKRSIAGYAPYVWQLNMNMDRIKDKKIRDAITYALPNGQIYKPDGGNYGGEPAGGLLAPTVPGYEKGYDPYGKLAKPNGDPEKARALLKKAGKEGMKLVYAYSNIPVRQQQSVIIEKALEKAGFDVQKKEVDNATWYEQMGKVKNGFDVYMTGWGQDWASASTVIPPSFDGTQIQDGASNYAHLNDEHVNSEIQRILKITDPAKSAKEWNTLQKYIVEKINPAAPMYFVKVLQVQGSNVGGARYSTEKSYIDLTNIFLKK
ncbi:ABC transporter substrate-binding protein [Streptomyces sp. NBC_01304]|uniref:ABC transporter substrate-binding protein n=1 Tax=Streptomyces sp. NBC_01304 TaxID=2903818 RepID=UPI002E16058E|nr:ABC transporter substrate-binding protein [Streptomyces sp. NBC_01304]